jgi:hypothetical protein
MISQQQVIVFCLTYVYMNHGRYLGHIVQGQSLKLGGVFFNDTYENTSVLK